MIREVVEGVHGGVDSTLGHGSGQHGGGVQVSEGGGGGGIGQVVGGHVDGLDRGNGTLGGGGDSLLHTTHVSGQSWLVTDSRWDTTKQSRHFRTSLGESENVVNEKKHILSLLVTEIFGKSESSQSNTGTGAGGLVHLTVDKGDLGGLVLETDDTSLNHLVVQVISLTGSLSDSGKDGVTSMSLGDVVDQFHDQDSLADSSTTEETNLTSLGIRGKEVDNLDTSDKDLLLNAHLLELGGLGVDGLTLVGGNGTPLIDWLTNNIDDSSKGFGSNWDHDGVAGVVDNLATDETLGTVHGDGSDGVLSQVLGDLQDELGGSVLNLQGVKNLWESIFKLNVDNGTNNGDNLALWKSSCSSRGAH